MIRQSLGLRQVQINAPGDFYDRFAGRWESLFADLKQDSEHLANALLHPLLKRFECRSIVDVGCGTGYDLKALHAVNPDLSLAGFDLSAPMVEQAGDTGPIKLAGGDEWDMSSEGLPDALARGTLGRATFDAVLCLGNTLCHVAPGKLSIAFANLASMLNEGGVAVIEFRDGDRLKDFIESSPYSHVSSDGQELKLAYEHRCLTHGDGGRVTDSFFRYVSRDAQTFTINSYFVEFQDEYGYHNETLERPAVATCIRSMNVAYVFPDVVRTRLFEAGFDARQVGDYPSALRFGTILLAQKVGAR